MNIKDKMDLLNITDVSTPRQTKNGTVVWRLPIKNNWPGNQANASFIEVASFSTGYVRNQNSGYSNYQLNKRCDSKPEYYNINPPCQEPLYRKFTTRSCVLIPNEKDRLEYLIAYCLKNYYIKHANQVAEGKYVPEWYHNNKLEQKAIKEESYSQYKKLENMTEARDYYLNKTNNLENKLSNAISPTKYQCAINKLHHLENKLATINRISSNE